jgi:hypothetical protein
VGGGDVPQDTAGADRRELLVVPDEAHGPAAGDDEVDGGGQGQGVGHARLVDDHQCPGPDVLGPVGQVVVGDGPDQLGQGVGAGAELLTQDRGGRGGRGEPDDGAAVGVPGGGQGAHGGGLPGPGGRDGQLQPVTPEVAIPVTSAACPALRVTPFAACSSSAIHRVLAGGARRRDRPVSRGAAPRPGSRLVNRADPATSYTLDPSAAQLRGSATSSWGGDPHRPGGEDLVDEPGPRPPPPGRRAGRRRGPGVAPRRARATPATSSRASCRVPIDAGGGPHPRRVHGSRVARAGWGTGPR